VEGSLADTLGNVESFILERAAFSDSKTSKPRIIAYRTFPARLLTGISRPFIFATIFGSSRNATFGLLDAFFESCMATNAA
jgi:hypothetical protein